MIGNTTGEMYTSYLKNICEIPKIKSTDWKPAYPKEFKNRISSYHGNKLHIDSEYEFLQRIPTPEKQQYANVKYATQPMDEEDEAYLLQLDHKSVYLKRNNMIVPHRAALEAVKTKPFYAVDLPVTVFDRKDGIADKAYEKFRTLFDYDTIKHSRFEKRKFVSVSNDEILLFVDIPYEYYSRVCTHDDFLGYSEKDETFLACDTLEAKDIKKAADDIAKNGFDIPVYLKIVDGNIVSYKYSKRQMLLALYFGLPTIPGCIVTTSVNMDSLEELVPMDDETKKMAIDVFGPELTWV